MKNKIWFAVNLVLVSVIAFLAFGKNIDAQKVDVQKRDVWEYKIQRVSLNQIDRPEFYINQSGQDGWELVTVDFFENELTPTLIFKRKK